MAANKRRRVSASDKALIARTVKTHLYISALVKQTTGVSSSMLLFTLLNKTLANLSPFNSQTVYTH